MAPGPFLLVVLLQTQPVSATVLGTVRDGATGDPVSYAAVTLPDLHLEMVTGADGRYRFDRMPAGPQHLTVTRIGYAPRTLHALVPAAGALEIDVVLRPTPVVLPGVTVQRQPPGSSFDGVGGGSEFDHRIAAAQLVHHPALAEADFLRVLRGGVVTLDPEAPSGVHVRGGASDHTGYTLDGIPVFSPYHAAGTFGTWNPDALADVRMLTAAPPVSLPDALSGTIAARTTEPGARLGLRGAISNTQGRLTADGPLGERASYLVGVRSNLPARLATKDEASYLHARHADFIATFATRAAGGTLRGLLFGSGNRLRAASGRDEPGAPPDHTFDWSSRSGGVTWSGRVGAADIELTGWRASARAATTWVTPDDSDRLDSRRRDHGLRVMLTRGSAQAGARVEWIDTRYSVEGSDAVFADASLTIPTLFVEHGLRMSDVVAVRTGVSASRIASAWHASPRIEMQVQGPAGFAAMIAVSRMHQPVQSLRNPESVAGHIFPADLFLAAGASGMPVPRSDQVVAALVARPVRGVGLELEAFVRTFSDLALVAAGEAHPFATRSWHTGSATARGAAVELTAAGARHVVLVGYGLQRVRVQHADSGWTPRYGDAHTLDAGVTFHPTSTASLRIAATFITGRTAAPVGGSFEWEACNLLDLGCEFSGTPRVAGAAGGTLPAYLRLDVGARKHWHVRLHGRDTRIGVHATLTNVFGRDNVLAWLEDPDTDARQAVTMLPRSPLVIGIDWRR